MKDGIGELARISKEDIDKRTKRLKNNSNSIESQLALINRFLDENPILCHLPRHKFVDDGHTGTNFDRPGFKQMLDLIKRGEISIVVVKDLSRLGRNYIEAGEYLDRIFPSLGVRVIAIDDHYDSADHAGYTPGMMISFKNLINDYYCRDLSQKVKSAVNARQLQSGYVNCVPYGYQRHPTQKHRMIPDPVTAPVVKRIFENYIGGSTTTAIALALNREGILCPSQYKRAAAPDPGEQPSGNGQWTHRTILSIIKNLKYTGTMVNHLRESQHLCDNNQKRLPPEQWYIHENAHEAIVTREEYDRAQKMIRHPKRVSRARHDRSDRVYYCGHCGHKLEKQNGTVFACASHRFCVRSACEQVRWEKKALENVLLEALQMQLRVSGDSPPSKTAAAKKQSKDLSVHLTRLKNAIKACDRENLALYEQYCFGALSVEEYKARKSRYADQRACLEEELSAAECAYQTALQESEPAPSFDPQLQNASEEALREHLYDTVERVTIYNVNEIEITWKYGDRFAG